MAQGHFTVLVDDNFNYMNEHERYELGAYDTLDEAFAHCKRIVDQFLLENADKAASADELYQTYTQFGEDPFVRGPAKVEFSACDYAKQRCKEIFGEKEGR